MKATIQFMAANWPYVFEATSIVTGLAAGIHAVMTKRDVRAATSWLGLILLTPLIGAILYVAFGINRVRIRRVIRRRKAATMAVRAGSAQIGDRKPLSRDIGAQLLKMKRIGDSISEFKLLDGNQIEAFTTGDDAYEAMLSAIDAAKNWILLETYIFDADSIGRRFVDSLELARKRGVEVRVLVDAVGAQYSRPRITKLLNARNVPWATFRGNFFTSHFRSINLRTHRKLLVVDGQCAFWGGMNIREAFSKVSGAPDPQQDMHFSIRGPCIGDLAQVFAGDWLFSTGERLPDDALAYASTKVMRRVLARVVASGPDKNVACNHEMLIGILNLAESRVSIATPYFLPSRELIGALVLASRRGVTIDIILPQASNLPLIDHAMRVHLEEVVQTGCRVWRGKGSFDHSKLVAVDDKWIFVGSSNLDARSLRLNFEIDLEAYDSNLAKSLRLHIDSHIQKAELVTRSSLRGRPFLHRLRDRLVWLASPFL